MNGFVELTAKSATGVYRVLVALDSISTIIEGKRGSQIACKNTDIIPLKETYDEVVKAIEAASNGTPKF